MENKKVKAESLKGVGVKGAKSKKYLKQKQTIWKR